MIELLTSIPDRFLPHVEVGLRVIFIAAIATVTAILMRRLVGRLRFHLVRDLEMEKRAATVAAVFRTLVTVMVVMIATAMILREMGFDIGPLIAGAGVAGIAIGLGSQHLFKDLLNGFFLLLDDQIRVGDSAVINGTGGVVEQLNLRTTVLRDGEGVLHYFQNGNITSLANKTRDYSNYIFQIGLAYTADVDRAFAIMRQIGEDVKASEYGKVIQKPLEIWGVDQFVETGVVIKARIQTLPGQQWGVGREMNKRIKAAFEAAGIDFQARPPAIDLGALAAPKKELDGVKVEAVPARGNIDS